MIPLSIPNLQGNEWKYIKECLDTNWVSSVGSFVDRFETALQEFTGAKHAVACVNGSAALHISLKLAGVERDDYVLVPNLTFVASANTITYCNAAPIFLDVEPRTWQLDLDLLSEFLDNKTFLDEKGELRLTENRRRIKAIMPVHVLGNMLDMNRLLEICEQFHLTIVEDSTEALGSYYKGQHAGTFGKLGCLSFNGNKIITTGGGGIILSNEEELALKAKHITTQAKASKQEYFHDEIGYNYRLVNLLAAMGVAQMEQLPTILLRKKEINQFYRTQLESIEGIRFQEQLERADVNHWLFTILTSRKAALLEHLQKNRIQARPFWVPMNQLPMFAHCQYIQNKDHSNQLYEKAISIPCSSGITDAELVQVKDSIQEFFQHSSL
ncbi:MAG: LegC family aminotransferase [Bacteroidota bacterium]